MTPAADTLRRDEVVNLPTATGARRTIRATVAEVHEILAPPKGGPAVWLRDTGGRAWHVASGTPAHARLLAAGAVEIPAPADGEG